MKNKFKKIFNIVWYIVTVVCMLLAFWKEDLPMLLACLGFVIIDRLGDLEKWLKVNASILMDLKDKED